MAGLEVVVRPVVFPDIRPQAPRLLPPVEDPEKGICEIKGANSFVVQFSTSSSFSVSFDKATETKRQVDVARVYQKKKDGKINKENYVDIEVANKVWLKGGKSPGPTFKGFTGDDVVPTIPGRGYNGDDVKVRNYARPKKAKNIEILEKDQIRENTEGGGE